MRIVAGDLKGRSLASPGGKVRPTADRVREAVFSILGSIEGARVLDLFCGTGALGIEALSRGAERAVLVDSDVTTVRRNVSGLGLEGRATVVHSDAIRYLRRPGAAERFDLIFCDPPYKLADRLAPDLESLVPHRLAPGGRVIVETAARAPLTLSLPMERERRYGETLIRVHGAQDDEVGP